MRLYKHLFIIQDVPQKYKLPIHELYMISKEYKLCGHKNIINFHVLKISKRIIIYIVTRFI